MKKILLLVLLSTVAELYAQSTLHVFDFNPDFRRRFIINLEHGERMQIELTSPDDLHSLPDIDSLTMMFDDELWQMKDTLRGEQFGRRIDYVIDEFQVKRVRVRKWIKPEIYYAVKNDNVSRLKIEQDTITITGPTTKPGHYYRFTFFLNELSSLAVYNNGQLGTHVQNLQKHVHTKWKINEQAMAYLVSHPDITAYTEQGKAGVKNMIILRPSVDIQNYREQFVPSISLGIALGRTVGNRYTEYGIGTETHFRFTKDIAGNSQTHINTFTTISFGRGTASPQSPTPVRLFPYISVGYLFKNNAVYEKNTLKLGVGRFFLGNRSTKIEPTLYMNYFFKNVTPSLRVVQAL